MPTQPARVEISDVSIMVRQRDGSELSDLQRAVIRLTLRREPTKLWLKAFSSAYNRQLAESKVDGYIGRKFDPESARTTEGENGRVAFVPELLSSSKTVLMVDNLYSAHGQQEQVARDTLDYLRQVVRQANDDYLNEAGGNYRAATEIQNRYYEMSKEVSKDVFMELRNSN